MSHFAVGANFDEDDMLDGDKDSIHRSAWVLLLMMEKDSSDVFCHSSRSRKLPCKYYESSFKLIH